MHYQRLRREGAEDFGPAGRPPQYPQTPGKSYRGAPMISVRFEPEVLEWVKANGGAGFLRKLTEKLHDLVQEEDFQETWERIKPD